MSGQGSGQGETVDAVPPDSVVLVSSDEKRIPFPRLLLAAMSSVFRDMFEITNSSDASKHDCQVSETGEELAALASALEGKTSHDEITWLSMYRMMYKYDIPMLRTVLLLSAREALVRDPIFAFSAAAILSDRTLQREAEIPCLGFDLSAVQKQIWLQAPDAERLRLRLCHAQVEKIALEILAAASANAGGSRQNGPPPAHTNTCPGRSKDHQAAYEDALLLILKRMHNDGMSRNRFAINLSDLPSDHALHAWCSFCKEHLSERLNGLARDWRVKLELMSALWVV